MCVCAWPDSNQVRTPPSAVLTVKEKQNHETARNSARAVVLLRYIRYSRCVHTPRALAIIPKSRTVQVLQVRYLADYYEQQKVALPTIVGVRFQGEPLNTVGLHIAAKRETRPG